MSIVLKKILCPTDFSENSEHAMKYALALATLSQAQLEDLGGGRLRLSGELSFRTVPDLLRQGRGRFEGASRFHLDLSGVTRTDSAGLALLLEWLQACRRRQQDLLLQDLPESLAAIARVSNLDRLLERLRA